GYACATKLIARLLWTIGQKMEYALAHINAGNLHNAIARDAQAIIGIDPSDRSNSLSSSTSLSPRLTMSTSTPSRARSLHAAAWTLPPPSSMVAPLSAS
ncbi:MAG: hypothetical protein II022_02135, partial [Muribaculaceae bacterium]|nr:hypothetical protein [Muribaculaceae bacterium]